MVVRSKVSARGRTTVPIAIRKKLGLGAGSVLEWEEEGGRIVIRRAGRYSFEDIHKAIFAGKPPKHVTIEEMDEGIRTYMRKKYGRRD